MRQDTIRGRSAGFNVPNRFERFSREPLEIEVPTDEEKRTIPTMYFRDSSRTILAKNESPDLPFTYSINPYRGCEHGCIYCYARPSHEYLGFSAGIDFESKILVKLNAPRLLDEALSAKSWMPQVIAFSGNTDCYQPAEHTLQLTRKCLQVSLAHRNPVGIVTKNAMVLRDLDLLREMAEQNLVHVLISITSLDAALVRVMEPRTSTPAVRVQTIERLASAGVPAGVNAAPIIPGLTDEELPRILKSAADAGATCAGYSLLRLPGAVEPLFLDWLKRQVPDRAAKIVNRIRDTRGGQLNDSSFGLRMSGEGGIAKAIDALFDLHARKYDLLDRWQELSTDKFRRTGSDQKDLFEV